MDRPAFNQKSEIGNQKYTWLCITIMVMAASLVGAASAGDLDKVKEAEAQREALINRVYGTVVCVYGENPAAGGGSGVLIDPSGLTLTNFHVVKEAGKTGWAGLADERLYRWRLIGVDPGGDVALIQLVGRDDFPYASLADSDRVRIGDRVLAMGNPFALAEDQTPSVSFGIVSGVHRYQEGTPGNLLVYGDCIQVDSSINPGNSGGPLFDMNGQVIGINGRGSFEERGRVNVGLGYAISSNQIRNFLPELLATKIAQHATLDATFADRDGRVIATAIDTERCKLAERGLRLGDRLLTFNGKTVERANQLTRWLTTVPAGWPAAVTWEHNGQRFGTVVALNALPYGKGEQPRIRMRLPIDGPRRNELIPIDFEVPANMPGAIEDLETNQELAMMLIHRCDQLFQLPITDAMILGGEPVAGGVGIELQVMDNGEEKYVTLTDDLLKPTVIEMTEPMVMPVAAPRPAAAGDSWAADVIDSAQRKCVKIFGAGIGREHGYATGLIVSADGLILAAQGVYLDGQRIRAVTSDGTTCLASVVRRDATSQLALLKIDATTPEYWRLDEATVRDAACQPGDWVLAISNAFKVAEGAEPLSATMGIVSLRGKLETKKRLQDFDVGGDVLLIDAITANPGAPGGAVVDTRGRLVGMIGKTLESQATNTWVNYAIPSDRLAEFVNDQRTQTTGATPPPIAEKPGEVGIRIFAASGRRAPAYIDRVAPDSPAAKAGLKADDLVLSIDQQWIRTVEEYEAAANQFRAGQTVIVTIKRGKRVLQMTLTPEAKP